ncbi:MAG: hypothetical protein ABFR62_00385 [Bacteroidota bacterium]
MKNITKIIVVALIATFPLLNSSCDKDPLESYDVSLEEAKSVMLTEAMLNLSYIDVFNTAIRAGAFADEELKKMAKMNNTAIEDILGGEMSILTEDGQPNLPATIKIDWGATNKKGDDGFNRRGMMIARLSNYWSEPSSTITIEFKDYYFNDYKIEGETAFTYEGGNLYHLTIINGKVTSPEGKIAERNSDTYMNWAEGSDTKMDITDDVWELYGVIGGKTTEELEYTMSISADTPLSKATSCKYPNSGISNFTIKGIKFALDYSFENSECDNKATLDFYGLKKEIVFN